MTTETWSQLGERIDHWMSQAAIRRDRMDEHIRTEAAKIRDENLERKLQEPEPGYVQRQVRVYSLPRD